MWLFLQFWWWEEKIQVDFSDLQGPNTQFFCYSYLPYTFCPIHPTTAVCFSYNSKQNANNPLLLKPQTDF